MQQVKDKLLHWICFSLVKQGCGKCCLTCEFYRLCENDSRLEGSKP